MGAVQNAMQRDGLDPTIMDLDPDKSLASQLKKEEDDGPPLKDDPKYQKYFKVCSSSVHFVHHVVQPSIQLLFMQLSLFHCVSRC